MCEGIFSGKWYDVEGGLLERDIIGKLVLSGKRYNLEKGIFWKEVVCGERLQPYVVWRSIL